MGFEEFSFLESVAAEDPGPLARAMLASEKQDRVSEAAETRERAEKEASRQARTEAMLLQNRQLGDPLGELSRAQHEVARFNDEVTDLRARLERAEGKLARARGNVEFFARRAQQVTDSIQRSAAPDDLLAPAKAAHREFAQATRAALSDAVTGRKPRARRPKGSGGDAAVRSHTCVHCTADGISDEESFFAHNDPEHPLPVTSPEMWAAERGETDWAQVDRLVEQGYSRSVAVEAATPLRREIAR